MTFPRRHGKFHSGACPARRFCIRWSTLRIARIMRSPRRMARMHSGTSASGRAATAPPAEKSCSRPDLSPLKFLRRLLQRFPEATAIARCGDSVAVEITGVSGSRTSRLSSNGSSGFSGLQRPFREQIPAPDRLSHSGTPDGTHRAPLPRMPGASLQARPT